MTQKKKAKPISELEEQKQKDADFEVVRRAFLATWTVCDFKLP